MPRPIAATPIVMALVNALLVIALPANAQALVQGVVKQVVDVMEEDTVSMATLLSAGLLIIIVISIAMEQMIHVVMSLALLPVFALRIGLAKLGTLAQEGLR